MWLKRLLLISILVTTPAAGLAEKISTCQPRDFLLGGFNQKAYKNCVVQMQQCPADGPLKNSTCVDSVTKKAPECNQLKQLADALNLSIPQLSAKSINGFTVITEFFPADGQKQYAIVTPKGCLIATTIDPRTLSKSLARKYSGSTFVMAATGEPVYKQHRDGSQTFTVILRASENCLACKVLGWAKIKFEFTKDGTLKKIKLDDFSSVPPSD